MKTTLFDFELPEALIAVQPAEPRDSARMLVVADSLVDAGVSNLTDYLRAGDVMVFNDTRVIPARLFGKRGDAKVELLLHKRLRHPELVEGSLRPFDCAQGDKSIWRCFAKPAKRLKVGDVLRFAENFSAQITDKLESGEVVAAFSSFSSPSKGEGRVGGIAPPPLPSPLPQGERGFYELLAKHGHMPLPPYIRREDTAEDQSQYQTVYAKHNGSVAAPTAGLHFTEALLAKIDAMGVKRVSVTLHVGGGTFLPVKAEDTKDHVMHSEYAEVSKEVADAINQAKANGGRVIAVGTTSLRTLETAADQEGQIQPCAAETDIFITPGYHFKSVDLLLTNFHLPRSTLFMLVSAFSGLERMKAAYAHAIAQRYRFYSYGDACLLYRQ